MTKEYLKVEKEEASKANPDWDRLEALGSGALRRAVVEGNLDTGSFMAGQIAGLVDKRETVSEIIQSYMTECKETIAARASEWL